MTITVKADQLWKDKKGNLWKPVRLKRGKIPGEGGWWCIEWSSWSDDESLFPLENFGTELTFVRNKA